MPDRRGLRGGIAAAGADIGQTFGALSQQYGSDRLQRRRSQDSALLQDRLERERKADELIQAGKLKPSEREAFINGSQEGPSVTDKLASMLGNITKAPTFQEVPGVTALAQQAQSEDIPTVGFDPNVLQRSKPGGPQRIAADETNGNLPSRQAGPSSTPEFNTLLQGREQKLNSFAPTAEDYVDTTGLKRRRYMASRPDQQTGRDVPTEPTPEQAGANKKTELLTGELSPEVQGARANLAGLESGARTRAQQAQEIASSGLTSQQQQAALSLSDNFTQESREFYVIQDQYRRLRSVATDPSAAGDLGVIFSYMKILDPGSTVREGEQATAQNATSTPDWVMNLYNRIVTGEKLSPTQRADFVKQAGALFTGASTEHQRRVQTYAARAQGMHIPAHFVVREVAPDLQGMANEGNPLDELRKGAIYGPTQR